MRIHSAWATVHCDRKIMKKISKTYENNREIKKKLNAIWQRLGDRNLASVFAIFRENRYFLWVSEAAR